MIHVLSNMLTFSIILNLFWYTFWFLFGEKEERIEIMSGNLINSIRQREKSDYWLGKLGRGITRLVEKCGTIFAHLTSFGVIIMILIGTIDVIGAKLFNTPLPTTYEVTEALMVVITFGGLAFVQHKKSHIKVDLLFVRFSPKLQILSELTGYLIGLVFFGAFTWRAALLFWESYEIKEFAEALIPFPIYPSKFLMLLGVGLFTAQLLVDTIQTIIRLVTGEIISLKEQA